MSPRDKHIPDEATLTSIKLTEEDKTAIHLIKMARKRRGEDRDRMNDILVDGLWLLLKTVERKTIEDVRGMLPPPSSAPAFQ
ncbi:MAG: hypothetical protein ACLPH3_23115, partial [Terracidiphilus sp.]